jgi:RNA polymerase sigma-70 factor (ECF subfamily)
MSQTLDGQEPLLVAAVSGDVAALKELLLAHHDLLYAHICRRFPPQLNSVAAAEDILQQTFVQVVESITTVKTRTAEGFAAWLRAVADSRLQQAIKDVNRKKRGGGWRRTTSGSGAGPSLSELARDTADTPARVAAGREAAQAIGTEMSELPSEQRQAIRLRFIEGKSLEETAAAMSRTPGAIRGLVHRAKAALRAALGRSSRWLTRR